MTWWERILKLFGFTTEPKVPSESSKLAAQRRDTRADAVETGAYPSFADLREDLAEKFERLELTKFHAHRGPVFQSQLIKYAGAYMTGGETMFQCHELEPQVVALMPSVFMSSMPMDLEEDNCIGSWMMLLKYAADDPQVEKVPKGWARYSMEVLCSSSGNMPSFHTAMARYGVSPEGEVRELRYLRQNHYVTISGRHERRHEINQPKWGLSNLPRNVPRFYYLANAGAMRDFHWSVICRQDDKKIVCTIPDNDAPFFFRHRGKKKSRIFHSVRAHERHLKRKIAKVKTHYAGAREFSLDGIDYEICIPGKHYRPLTMNKEPLRE